MKGRRTYSQRAEVIKRAVVKRRSKIRKMAVDYKGGESQLCRYNRYIGALDFHHLDAKEKEFSISMTGSTRSWERVRNEVDKCVLLCANCHREVHAGIRKAPTK